MSEFTFPKNADLIYQHTLNIAKEQKESIIRLDAKLSALLAFSGLTLRFTENLHSNIARKALANTAETWCLSCKIISCFLALICAIMCIRGLIAKTRGIVADPEELLEDELYERNEEINKCYIIKGWINVINEYEKVGREKGNLLNLSLIFTILSVVFSAINIGVYTIFIQVYKP